MVALDQLFVHTPGLGTSFEQHLRNSLHLSFVLDTCRFCLGNLDFAQVLAVLTNKPD